MTETVQHQQPEAMLDKSNELAVLRQCLTGDWSEYGQVIRRYRRMVWAAIDAAVSDKEAIPDLVQDTFIRVYEKLHTFRFDASFSSWLYTIARNIGLNHNRRISRRPQVARADSEQMLEHQIRHSSNDITPVLRHQMESRQKALERMLGQLDGKYRAVLSVYYGSDLTYADVASTLRINVNTVRTRLKRGREQLMKMAIEEGWQ